MFIFYIVPLMYRMSSMKLIDIQDVLPAFKYLRRFCHVGTLSSFAPAVGRGRQMGNICCNRTLGRLRNTHPISTYPASMYHFSLVDVYQVMHIFVLISLRTRSIVVNI